jgi:hypothetical protein
MGHPLFTFIPCPRPHVGLSLRSARQPAYFFLNLPAAASGSTLFHLVQGRQASPYCQWGRPVYLLIYLFLGQYYSKSHA